MVGASVHLVHDEPMSFEECAARVDGPAFAPVSDPELLSGGGFIARHLSSFTPGGPEPI